MRICVTKICLLLSLAVIPLLCPATGFAAVAGTHLTAGGNTVNQTSYTTASITPTANNLVLAWVTNTRGATPATPTLSGNGLTWVRVATVAWGTIAAPTARTTLFRAMGAAPTAGAVTINFGAGSTQNGCAWTIEQFGGVDTSGTNGSGAVVQSVTGSANNSPAATGLSIPLAALGDPTNATAGGFSNRVNSATSISAGASYTAFTGAAYAAPDTSIVAEWRATGSTTVNVTQSAVSHIGGIAVEIKVSSLCYANTVTTTSDTGSGSLRECINRANGSPGTTISFNIPGPGNQSSGGNSWWQISPASVLPPITANGTVIDGTTQTTNVGNTNAVLLGSGGTVGVVGLALNRVAGPEVEIRGMGSLANGIRIQANNATVRGLAINGFGAVAGEAGIRIDDTFTGTLIENNVLGSTATSFSDPGAGSRNWIGIDSEGGDSGTIRNNLVGFSRITGIALNNASSNWTIDGNEIRDSGLETSDGDGITINASSTNTVTGNLFTGSSSQGIVVTVAGATGNVFTNNTVTGNGVGIPSGPVQSTGITMRSGAVSTVLDRNVVNANYGAGVQVNNGATGTRMTRNSMFANGTITARNGGAPTGQIGIDLNSPTDDIHLGTFPFYTLNDSGDADTGGNGLLNFPILSTAAVAGGNLTLTGFARPGSTIELFLSESPADPSGFGEGRTYLTTLVEGSAADLDITTGTYGPAAINGIAQGTDTTNRFRFVIPLPGGAGIGSLLTSTATIGNDTSEFSGNVMITAASYQPDAMVKLSTEGAGAYATDNVYEATAATQVKSQGVINASAATYNLFFQNDGNVSDNVVITQGALDNCAGFTVQYLDNTSTDRTAAVTGAGYAITGLAAGAGTTWTLRVTPAGTVAGGSPACRVSVTATSAGNGAKVDQVRAITSSTSASLTLLKSADRATVAPGQDITYTVNASNGAGLTPASAIVVTDPIPAYTGFRVGSATFAPGTSTLTGTPIYSNDNGATWTYTPAGGGCTAPAGYDFCVTNVRWTTTGTMPSGTNFTVTFVVRVK